MLGALLVIGLLLSKAQGFPNVKCDLAEFRDPDSYKAINSEWSSGVEILFRCVSSKHSGVARSLTVLVSSILWGRT